MSLDNAGIIADAMDGIGEVGFPVVFTRKAAQPGSPSSGAPTVTDDYAVTVVSTKTSKAFISNGQEITIAKTLLCGATGFVPRQGDKVTIAGYANPFGVARVMPVEPGGTAVLFKVDLST